jgi:hypothetical protein
VNSSSEIAQPQSADANTAATASSDVDGGVTNRMDARLAKMRQEGDAGSDVDPVALAMKNAKPAPDNSTFVSFLTDVGYEIRTFKNHPQLLKAEKTIAASGKQTLKVFLRNGRVVEVPADRVPALATVRAASLLEAAGLNQQPPAQQKAPAPSSQGQKKSGE